MILIKLFRIPFNFIADIVTVIGCGIFFGTVKSKNNSRIPDKGPIIFVANHPNMIFDPGLVRYTSSRRLHYIGKSTLFNNPIMSFMMRVLDVIPVYRSQDDPSQTHRNIDSFSECYKILEKKKCILFFPEGVSLGERVLFKIKSGASRVGLRCEEENDFNLDIKIMPVGINYSNPSRFKSDVYVNYGHPISVSKFKDFYREDKNNAITALTSEIEESLSELTANLGFIEMKNAIDYLDIIYKNELISELGLKIKNSDHQFTASKEMIDVIEWCMENCHERVIEFEYLASRYLRNLDRLKIKDTTITNTRKRLPLHLFVYNTIRDFLLFPIYIWGVLNNLFPYLFTFAFINTRKIHQAEIAQFKFFSGFFFFSLFYSIQGYFMFVLSKSIFITILYVFSLIPSGNLAMSYNRGVLEFFRYFRFVNIFFKKSSLIHEIERQRDDVIDLVDAMRNSYKERKIDG